mgnify:CR=1 FL=1
MGTYAAGYLLVVAVMSLICFLAYGWDKRQAGLGGWRVSEQSLHVMELLGGWPGALMGQRRFRHKTQKLRFRIIFWLMVSLHVSIVGGVGYAVYQR